MKKGQTTPLAAVAEKISMSLIDPFPHHPFYVLDDGEMIELIESIRKNGLISPIIVRPKGERYELISGHRRKRAYEYLGYAEIACSVINASDDEAVIMMVDSNCQRTKLLPSERAFAYKMKLDAMKRQGRRTDLTSAQLAQKSANKTSRQILAEQEGQSQDQIRRYIRLTNLVSELLEFVDLEKIKLCPAVELSYLDEEAQRDVVDQIDETGSFPSHAQTIRMRKMFEYGKLNYELVKKIMSEEKPNQKPKYSKRELDQLKHSFAITVHKAQGGQHPIVIIPVTNYHSVLLTRNLLYTAMTRAKQKLVFVGDRDALEYAIRNTQGLKRNTALCDRLKVSEQKAA